MKIWLDNLKEGDEFWTSHPSMGVYKCLHCGSANNPDYKMPRIKVKVLEAPHISLPLDVFDNSEMFVNTDVYDNYNEASSELKATLNTQIMTLQKHISEMQETLLSHESLLRKL